jgi:hypothetical protein
MTNDIRKDHRGDNEWRNLCKKVADEPDPQRLSELVDKLIKVLDARRQKNQQDGVDPSYTFGSTSYPGVD